MNNIVLDKTDDKQLNDTNNLGPWDSLLSNDLYGFTEEWTNLKKDNDILELSETLKNASKETNLCMNLINASYEDDVNIIVPDTKKNDEEKGSNIVKFKLGNYDSLTYLMLKNQTLIESLKDYNKSHTNETQKRKFFPDELIHVVATLACQMFACRSWKTLSGIILLWNN